MLPRTGLIAELGSPGRPGRGAARRPGRARRRGPERGPVGQHRAAASRTPAGTTCTSPPSSAPASPSPRLHAEDAPARPGPAALPARRGGHAGRCARADRGGRPRRASRASSALHCDPTLDVGQVGLRVGPITGAADALTRPAGRPRRPHVPSAPHRGPHLRAGQARHPAARRALAAASTRGPAPAWCGEWSAPAPPRTSSRPRGELAGTLRMLDAVAWDDAEHLVRELIAQILAPYGVSAEVGYVRGVPAGGQRARARPSCSRRRRPGVLGPGGTVDHAAEPGRGGLRVVRRVCSRRDGPARHAHAGRARRTTCTRAICASTSVPSASAPGCSPPPRWPRWPLTTGPPPGSPTDNTSATSDRLRDEAARQGLG